MQTVVTHSGSFDPDDVLAVGLLQIYLGIDNIKIIRSRDQSVIDQADWVVDVGGIYDVSTNRFDHHQNGVPKRDNGVPYSALGLLWREFGEELSGSIEAADMIEKSIVQAIDSCDNHLAISMSIHTEVKPFEFFEVIDTFKPVWGSDEDFDSQFLQAVDFARVLLERMIVHTKGNIAMHKMIERKYLEADDKTLIVFEEPVNRYSMVEYQDLKIAVSPVHAHDVNNWMAVVIPEKQHGFGNRAAFPDSWSGLESGELAEVSGIESAVFCHKNHYIFVAKTKEGAVKAARHALV